MARSSMLWLLNALIIFGVFFWSGTRTERTVYDRYAIGLGALEFSVSNHEAAKTFYHEVLALKPVTLGNFGSFFSRSALELPDGTLIMLREAEKLASSSEEAEYFPARGRVFVRVRTGIERLHQILLSAQAKHSLGQISEIKRIEGGAFFTAADPDGNEIIYSSFRARLRAGKPFVKAATPRNSEE